MASMAASDSPKPKLRWHQFSLRTLMVFAFSQKATP
jgi:hypothetical protein